MHRIDEFLELGGAARAALPLRILHFPQQFRRGLLRDAAIGAPRDGRGQKFVDDRRPARGVGAEQEPLVPLAPGAVLIRRDRAFDALLPESNE